MALIYYMSQELRGIVVKRFRKGFEFAWLFSLRQKRILNYLVISLELPLLVVSTVAAPARAPKITQLYTTAETSTSAEVVWNTNTASDSLLQYSTTNPVPAQAAQVYLPNQATVHEIPLTGLTPGTV